MKFNELHEHLPYCIGKDFKILSHSPYAFVEVLFPGRHQKETTPKGGDFTVVIKDATVSRGGQFKHDDIFDDVEIKTKIDEGSTLLFMEQYMNVISSTGASPLDYEWFSESETYFPFNTGAGIEPNVIYTEIPKGWELTIYPNTLLAALQCLAVAEHRRYAKYESKFGGRFLPFRFSAGIAERLWTAEDAKMAQKKGRPGVEFLEMKNGTPTLTRNLMGS